MVTDTVTYMERNGVIFQSTGGCWNQHKDDPWELEGEEKIEDNPRRLYPANYRSFASRFEEPEPRPPLWVEQIRVFNEWLKAKKGCASIPEVEELRIEKRVRKLRIDEVVRKKIEADKAKERIRKQREEVEQARNRLNLKGLAKEIASDLFSCGLLGPKVKRLVMEIDHHLDGPGWGGN